jgi:TrmH family RNA methyltransferase
VSARAGRTRPALRLVLVAPRTAGNVGACARLAENFGVTDWVIVDPRCAIDGWDARKFATGSSAARLDAVRIVPGLAEALADCRAAVGFVGRDLGRTRRAPLAPRDLTHLCVRTGGTVALVFGTEETGLSGDELAACTHVCVIPTSESLPSLNLSHATAVALARIFEDSEMAPSGRRALARSSMPTNSPAPHARLAELAGLVGHWREFLIDAGMDRGGNPERLLRTVRAVLERSGLSEQEIRAFRGMLSKAQVRIGTRVRGRRLTRSNDP